MPISSRTSRTSTSSPCLPLAARAARRARSTDSVTSRAAPADPRSSWLEVPSHHDGDVRDPRGLWTNVHHSHAQQGLNALGLAEELVARGNHLGGPHDP